MAGFDGGLVPSFEQKQGEKKGKGGGVHCLQSTYYVPGTVWILKEDLIPSAAQPFVASTPCRWFDR